MHANQLHKLAKIEFNSKKGALSKIVAKMIEKEVEKRKWKKKRKQSFG